MSAERTSQEKLNFANKQFAQLRLLGLTNQQIRSIVNAYGVGNVPSIIALTVRSRKLGFKIDDAIAYFGECGQLSGTKALQRLRSDGFKLPDMGKQKLDLVLNGAKELVGILYQLEPQPILGEDVNPVIEEFFSRSNQTL